MKKILFIILIVSFEKSNSINRNVSINKNKDLRVLQINNEGTTNKNNKELSSAYAINYNNIENSNKKKNLIIGTIINFGWDKMSTFFKSYIRAGFENCDIVMFISNISPKTVSKMKSYGIIVYNMPDLPDKFKKKGICSYRWKIYEDYLKENKNRYKQVFTGDIRDTFFQIDFFKFYEKKKSFLGIALEDGTLSDKYNKKWIVNLYGDDIYRTIKHERIVCMGSVWGTIDKMIDFSRMVWEGLITEKALRVDTADQAVGNYLIYINKTFDEYLVKSNNKNGLIMTIGLTNITDIHFDSENNMLNGNGEIAAVIHQYDRKKEIVTIFNEALTKPLKIPYKGKLFKYPINYILYIILAIIFSIFGVFHLCRLKKIKLKKKYNKSFSFFRVLCLCRPKKIKLKKKYNTSSYPIIKYSNYITKSAI